MDAITLKRAAHALPHVKQREEVVGLWRQSRLLFLMVAKRGWEGVTGDNGPVPFFPILIKEILRSSFVIHNMRVVSDRYNDNRPVLQNSILQL